jgi:hypothetical protein
VSAPCRCGGRLCRLDAGSHRHGTYTGYHNHDCRCDRCREAHRAWMCAKRERCAATRTCPNCKGPGGEYGGGMCNACREYQRLNGVARPERLYNPQPRTCANCGKTQPKGKGRRHGRCETCARYWDRNGRERPERLWRKHLVGAVNGRSHGHPGTATSTTPVTEPVGTGVSRGMPDGPHQHHQGAADA